MSIDYSFAQLPDTTPMNRLPLVITAPGDYVTRAGDRVTIHEIRMYAPRPHGPLRHAVTAFEAKGSLWRTIGKTYRPAEYDVWHLSGHHVAVDDSPLDIVGPWPQ